MTDGEQQEARFCSCCIILFSEMSLQNIIKIYHGCDGRIKKSVPRIAVWHHEACQVMTNGDSEGRIFFHILTQIMDSFSCSPLYLFVH